MNDEDERKRKQRANYAYFVINSLMGELHGARLTYLFASEKFLKTNKTLEGNISESARVYIRRIALCSVASIMFRYTELYQGSLKAIGCNSELAKKLFALAKSSKLTSFRQACHHIFKKDGKSEFSAKDIDDILNKIGSTFTDLFFGDSKVLMNQFQEVRDEIQSKYPEVKDAVKNWNSGDLQ